MNKTAVLLFVMMLVLLFSACDIFLGNQPADANSDPSDQTDDEEDDQNDSPGAPVTYNIYDIALVSSTDTDGDGHARSITVSVDADVSEGSAYVYLVFYYSLGDSGWISFGTSDSFSILEYSTSDTRTFDIYGFDHNIYDFGFELYDASDNTFKDSYTPDDNPDLSGVALETDDEDTPREVWLSYHDGVFEGENGNNGYGVIGVHEFPVEFSVPAEASNALSCRVKEVRCYISRLEEPGEIPAHVDIIDSLTNHLNLDTTDIFYPEQTGWLSFEADADLEGVDSFVVSFEYASLDSFSDDLAIGIDTSDPVSCKCYSYFFNRINLTYSWSPIIVEDFGIEVLLEYTVAGLD